MFEIENQAMANFTIWVTDDDEEDFMMLKDAFNYKKYSHSLLNIPNGLELIEILSEPKLSKKEIPDLILLDINMPGLDGINVLKLIRRMEHCQEIPVFMYTTSRDSFERMQCLKQGANAFYSKFNSFEKLLRFVEEINDYLVSKTHESKL